MIFHVVLVAAVYVGSKVYQSMTEKAALEQKTVEDTVELAALENKEQVLETKEQVLAQAQQQHEVEHDLKALEAKFAHYSKTSLLSAGLFAARSFIPGAGLLGLATYIYSVLPYIKEVEASTKGGRKLNVDALFLGADMLTLGTSQYVTAGISLWLSHAGKLSVLRAKDDSNKMITSIFAELPSEVWVLKGSIESKVPLDSLQINDLVVVNAGEMIPIDGVIHQGIVSVDQHALTGESQPAEKAEGDQVFANTVVINGRAVIRVEKSGQQTTSAKIGDVLLNATQYKSKVQLKGEQWAEMATTPITVASLVALPLLGVQSAVVLSNSHIGRRIRMLAPMATLSQLTLAAHKGILIKDGRILENLHDIDTIIFDKTGTLTTGEPKVGEIFHTDDISETQLLQYAATAEQKQSHPIAKAIMAAAKAQQISVDDIADSDYQIGFGITVTIGDKVIRVGSQRFMTSQHLEIAQALEIKAISAHQKGHTVVMVGVDDAVCGAIVLEPQIRPEVKKVLKGLRARGIEHMAIVSGDQDEPTAKLAEMLGMDDYFSQVLPQNKADIVGLLQSQGRKVCFIGDGINDTIAMKKANASISLSGASNIATDIAEIVLMDGTLEHLEAAFELSHELKDNLSHILTMAIAPGVLNIGGAFLFNFSIFTSLAVNFGAVAIAMVRIKGPLAIVAKEEKAALAAKQLSTRQIPDLRGNNGI